MQLMPVTELAIRERYHQVLEKITQSAQSVGRSVDSIRLIVVSKGQSVDVVQTAVSAGVKTFGENYAEEAVAKIQVLAEQADLEWHMIGHVQSRKAALVSRYFDMMHSLDRVKIARRLNRFAGELDRRLPVLFEFNVSGEPTKFGWDASRPDSWSGFLPDVEAILQLPHLEVQGLMTMPPFTINPEEARPFFLLLRQLRDFLAKRYPQTSWRELSMGMSADYKIAIQEGATMVRVGQAILGPRLNR